MDMLEEINWPETPMMDFFKNKTIFLTGATGGIGQLIVQKLIRINAGEICLLVRPKKGKSCLQRMTELFEGPVFKKARQKNPNFMKKINIFEGDLIEKNLGLSENDRNYIINNVQIVLHVAADVRFDQPLKHAVFNNVRAVYDVMSLAEKMKLLEVIIYMSTAYSNPQPFIEEKFYGTIIDPKLLIKLVENLDDLSEEKINILTPRITTPWETTYSFTKSMSEEMVHSYETKLPVAIIRPSIVIATSEDPIAGWIDNIYGLNGCLYGFGLGVLRILLCNPKFIGDVIPADFVANSTLATAWITAKENLEWKKIHGTSSFSPIKIYNCVSSPDNPVTWQQLGDEIGAHYKEFPSMKSVWHTTTNFTPSLFLFKFLTIIYQVLPTLFIDAFLKLKGKKLRVLKVYRLIQKNILSASCFMRNWKFDNKNLRNVFDQMSPDDHKIFPCDIKGMNWHEFNRRYCIGLRVYLGKDPLTTVEDAKKKQIIFLIAHNIYKLIVFSTLLYIFYLILKFYGFMDYFK